MPVSRHTRTYVLLSLFAYGLALLPTAVVADHTNLVAAGGVEYTIDPSEGNVTQCRPPTVNNACGDVLTLRIDGENFNGDNSTFIQSGREAVATQDADLTTLLTVSRRTYIPPDSNWVRSLSIITNDTLAPIFVDAEIFSPFSFSALTVLESSSGDMVADVGDVWLTLETDSSAAQTGIVWGNPDGTSIDQININTVRGGGGGAQLNFGWTGVTVPAGQTYIYMTFLTADVDATTALATTQDLATISDFASQFQGMTTDELSQVQNWAFPDSDNDGMPDYFENNFGLNPNDQADAALDGDTDGLTNLEEFNNATDPTDSDSDDDGLSDGDEVNTHGTNPNKSDSDGDGIGDGGEVNTGSDPLDAQDSAPTLVPISSGEDAWDPRVAIDSAGNSHVVWTQDSQGDFSYDGYEIYYALLDPAGETLIGPTRLTDNAEVDARARIAVDSMDRAVVVWQYDQTSGNMVRIDPATDDQNGDAADPATLIGVGPIAMLTDGNGHLALAVDGDDNIHVTGHDPCGAPLTYAKSDIDGVELIAETIILDNFSDCHANPDLAIDADGNVHIVYTRQPAVLPARGGSGYEMHYMMLNGATGAKLIDETALTEIDGFKAKHPTVNIDSNGLLQIVFGNSTIENPSDCQAGEVYRMVVDPSLDDQSGDAADPAVIRTVDQTLLSGDDGRHSWYTWSGLNSDGNIEITWNDGLTCRDGFDSRERFDVLRRMVIDTDGNVIVPPNTLTEDATGGMGNRYTVVVGNRAYWSEFIDGFDTIVIRGLGSVTLATATATGDATLTNDRGLISSAEAVNVADLPADAQAMAPRSIAFPDGLFRIVIDVATPGETVALSINLPTAVDNDTVYYKWNVPDGWQQFPFTQGATANDVVLMLTDGGPGDADGIANGQIVDPGGAGTNTNAAPTFTSMPVTAIDQGAAYSYPVTVTDANVGDSLVLAATTLPGWLTFVDNGNGTGTLTGTPAAANVGANAVTLTATDNAAIQGQTAQAFVINVAGTAVAVTVGGSGGGSGSTTPWLLLLASGLLFIRRRRIQKGAR